MTTGPNRNCQHPSKMTLFWEKRPNGKKMRHWICRKCFDCGSDPEENA